MVAQKGALAEWSRSLLKRRHSNVVMRAPRQYISQNCLGIYLLNILSLSRAVRYGGLSLLLLQYHEVTVGKSEEICVISNDEDLN